MNDPEPAAAELTLKVFEQGQPQSVFSTQVHGRLVIGRQDRGDPPPYRCVNKDDMGVFLVIAKVEETKVSRSHAAVEPLSNGKIRVESLKKRISVQRGTILEPGQSCEVDGWALLTFGNKTVRVEQAGGLIDQSSLKGLDQPTMRPGQMVDDAPTPIGDLLSSGSSSLNMEVLMRWLRSTMSVFQSAASSPDFLQHAAKSVAEIVGLDSAAALRWDGENWKIEGVFGKPREDWSPSKSMLARVLEEKRTFRQLPSGELANNPSHSIKDVVGLVAAPILNPDGEVIGAIYGDRRLLGQMAGQPEITELEAMLVELVAYGVAVGLARVDQEQRAIKLEQFFSPDVARQIEANPNLLTGKDAEVTVLFCDMRGFSSVSERVGPERTVKWMGDVLGMLSDCVIENQGVLVDYVGDELLAMWGAPSDLPEHAEFACRAALEMIDRLPELNQRWEEILEAPTQLGIGINTGRAHVGNTGSHRKFKYGPLGNTVNLGSRVQGATKHINRNLLITGSTAAKLDDRFNIRRLCQVSVVNINEPVQLYELTADIDESWPEFKQQYESALDSFNAQEFRAAAKVLGNLLAAYPNDGPTLALLSRAVTAMSKGPEEGHPVWTLDGK